MAARTHSPHTHTGVSDFILFFRNEHFSLLRLFLPFVLLLDKYQYTNVRYEKINSPLNAIIVALFMFLLSVFLLTPFYILSSFGEKKKKIGMKKWMSTSDA